MDQKKLKQLQQHWYKKLENTGFKDIEDDKGRLKTWSGAPLKDEMQPITSKKGYSSKLFKESQAEYYRLAAQYYYDKKFDSSDDKKIWRLHSIGSTYKQIAEEFRVSRRIIQARIEHMRKEFYK